MKAKKEKATLRQEKSLIHVVVVKSTRTFLFTQFPLNTVSPKQPATLWLKGGCV